MREFLESKNEKTPETLAFDAMSSGELKEGDEFILRPRHRSGVFLCKVVYAGTLAQEMVYLKKVDKDEETGEWKDLGILAEGRNGEDS